MLARDVGLLDLGDLVDVAEGEGGRNYVTGTLATKLETGSLLEEPGNWGRFDDELEGVVLVGGNGDGHGGVGLVLLGARVEVFAEGHQVESVLSQSRADGRCRASATARHDEADGSGDRATGNHILDRRH